MKKALMVTFLLLLGAAAWGQDVRSVRQVSDSTTFTVRNVAEASLFNDEEQTIYIARALDILGVKETDTTWLVEFEYNSVLTVYVCVHYFYHEPKTGIAVRRKN